MKYFLWLGLLCASGMVSGQKSITDQMHRYLQAQVDTHQFSGAVLVVHHGKIICDKAFGLANREWQTANTTDTRFPICSLTKQFTAAAILQLQEQGKLKTSDALSNYFPNFPKATQVTLHMLLNHTSGIRECTRDAKWSGLNPNLPVSVLKDSMLATFQNKPYDFEPGTFWGYSNSGYLLLGFIIEQVSGMSYNDYIRKNLLDKAGMNQSGPLTHNGIVPKMANAYSLLTGTWTKADTHAIEAVFAAGNLYATTHDLNRWRQALLSGKIISDASVQLMHTPNKIDYGAGYGIFVERFFNRKAWFHNGALSGINTYMIDYPDDHLRIIVLTNRDTNLDFIPMGLAGIVFGYDVQLSHRRTRSKKAPAVSALVGTYRAAHIPFPIELIEKDQKLYWRTHRDIEMVPESDRLFFVDEPDVEFQVEFDYGSDQKIAKAFAIEGGVRVPMIRTAASGK